VPKVEHGDGTTVVEVATPVFLLHSVTSAFRFVLAGLVQTLESLVLLVVSITTSIAWELPDPGLDLA
tara:strand:- start:310 stop:510 length:201 start_codon:yes stop_codon:yes gene_type:complete